MCATFLGTRLCLIDSYMKRENDTDYESQLNLQHHELFFIEIDPQKTKWYLFKNRLSDFAFFPFFNLKIFEKIYNS